MTFFVNKKANSVCHKVPPRSGEFLLCGRREWLPQIFQELSQAQARQRNIGTEKLHLRLGMAKQERVGVRRWRSNRVHLRCERGRTHLHSQGSHGECQVDKSIDKSVCDRVRFSRRFHTCLRSAL